MSLLKRIVLDILKPHHPNALEFAKAIADQGENQRVKLSVKEVDEKTENIVVIIEGDNIQFDAIAEIVTSLGASLHSIDEVEVAGKRPDEA